ncbi:unnamed protein product [Urochloa decumbens]|uniref:non-specific serine/threonine protein kinase n=1 Tax=Urochloa decumbens TaxID=240449 RepID=A0ABC9DC88_9POAL
MLLSIHVPGAGSLSFNLSFSQPQSPANLHELLNCTGDATIDMEGLNLTKEFMWSVGRAQYVEAMRLWDRASGEMASFTTTFHFNITPVSSGLSGDGLVFFLVPLESGMPAGDSRGGALGILPRESRYWNNTAGIIAVEFDTFLNQEFQDYADISDDHIGIDSNFTKMAVVRYNNISKLLVADLNINNIWYSVNKTIDLSKYLPENVSVGFSAATGSYAELHQILSWSFTSTLQEPPALVPLIPDSIQNPKKRSVGILIIAVLVPLLFLLACAAAVVLVWQKLRRRRRRSLGGTGTSDDDDNDHQEQGDSRAELERGVAASGPRRYAYRELAAATNNFADDGKLGRGGFGSVYRGKLSIAGEERLVAIKLLSSESSAQGRKQFEAEVRIISRLKHRNLVQLLGWCDSRHGLLLVYELVAQGSLDRHLHSSNSESFLTWPQRYQIILGLGSALRYLHQEWEQCVVHGDIKPSNIMLDESLSTKLGDFGLARLGDHGARWQTTRAVMGTAGYIDPEFVNTRHPSTYSDVYSFGIVLLEIVSGRCPVILLEGGAHFVLVKWMWGLYGRNVILDAADERLRTGNEADGKCMERVLVVGLWCAHPDQNERPSIAQAMHVLQSDDARLPELTPQMYRTASEFAVTGRAIGALSVQSSSSTTTTSGGHSKFSSESASSALLRDSKELV